MRFSKVFNELFAKYPEQPRKVIGLLARFIVGSESIADIEFHQKPHPYYQYRMDRPMIDEYQAAWILATSREYEKQHQYDTVG